MRTHTAMHILCGVIFRDYGALVTGGDMDPLAGRMDFEFETMHKDLVAEIGIPLTRVAKACPSRQNPAAGELTSRSRPHPDKDQSAAEGIQQVRVVEIVGLDLQADGARMYIIQPRLVVSAWSITNQGKRITNGSTSSWIINRLSVIYFRFVVRDAKFHRRHYLRCRIAGISAAYHLAVTASKYGWSSLT
jgi:hypothetical protein